MNNNEIRSTRLVLKGDKELAATHAGDAKHVLAQLGNIQQTGPGGKAIQTITKQFLDGTVIKARTDVKGLNIVEITSGNKSEKKYSEWSLAEETTTQNLVAIIPCGSVGYEITGMVCFNISEEKWGSLCESTNVVSLDSKDPVAPYTEQETYRKEWYDSKNAYSYGDETNKVEVETQTVRLQRVDGGWVAYEGDPSEYEDGGNFSTMIDYGNNYSVSDNDYQADVNASLVIDPGPSPSPPYDDWSWFGDGTTYEGEEGLFITVWAGGEPPAAGCVTAWWPPEFNQKISYQSKDDRMIIASVMTNEWGDYPASHIFTSYRRSRTLYENYRVWINLPSYDITEGLYEYLYRTQDTVSNSYPYKEITPITSLTDSAGAVIDVINNGIYIYHMLEHFIAPAHSYSSWDNYISIWEVDERLPGDLEMVCESVE
jgi:hypothetical protein